MARITRDSSVLNQFGSPSLNSNTIGNRPAAGQTGRLFVSTDTLVLYRDNGSIWQVVSAVGSTQNLEQTTTNGNTSTQGIFLGLTGSLSVGLQFEVSGYSRFSQTVASATNLGSNVNQYFELQTNGTTIVTGSPSAGFSQLTVRNNAAQTIGGAGNVAIGAGLFENVITDSGTGSYPLTITQTVGISALSPIISYSRYTGTFGSAISHYAGMVINGLQATAGSALSITNNYQLLINSSQQFSGSTTVTNRWGIYQAGANDNNYFAAKVLIGTSTPSSYLLEVASDSKISTAFIGTIFSLSTTATFSHTSRSTGGDYSILSDNVGNTIINGTGSGIIEFRHGNVNKLKMFSNGNINLGGATDTTRKLTVNGEQEWILTVGTGAHTTSGNHLPIWVNGTQYWLALLNPPILP